MSIFARPPYVSETTQFIQQMKAQRPMLEEEQRRGRLLLWDRAIDRQAQAEFREARIAQSPYVYQAEPSHTPGT